MDDLLAGVDRVARDTTFSGVVRVDVGNDVALAQAYGLSNRAYGIANQVDGQFGIASGTKALTALTIIRLIEEGCLELGTAARSVLGSDLPLIGGQVTVEHLLAHRSGIGDYLDEDMVADITDYLMAVPVHRLATPEQYLPILDGLPSRAPAGEQFSYCNGGYVILAIIAEHVGATPFPDLVARLVTTPAGMGATAFLRSDELPARAAVGYLAVDGVRTNVLHLPVRGSGDGGIFSTAADVHALWAAFLGGKIVSPRWVAEMIRPRSLVPSESRRYGLGFWLHDSGPAVMLEGYDAGVSFRTVHHPERQVTHTVLANTTDGAWPLTRHLDGVLDI